MVDDGLICFVRPVESYFLYTPPKLLIWFTFDKQLQIYHEPCFMKVLQSLICFMLTVQLLQVQWKQFAPVYVLCKKRLKDKRGWTNSHRSHQMLIKNRNHCCPKSKSLRRNLANGNFPHDYKTVCAAFVMMLWEPHDFGKEEWVVERKIHLWWPWSEWKFQAHLAGPHLRNLSPLCSGWLTPVRLG